MEGLVETVTKGGRMLYFMQSVSAASTGSYLLFSNSKGSVFQQELLDEPPLCINT